MYEVSDRKPLKELGFEALGSDGVTNFKQKSLFAFTKSYVERIATASDGGLTRLASYKQENYKTHNAENAAFCSSAVNTGCLETLAALPPIPKYERVPPKVHPSTWSF